MCGRFTVTVSSSVLADLFDLPEPIGFTPRFNIAPTQVVFVVRNDLTGQREWASCRWGLVPSWAKDPSIGSRMINARSETAAEKPSFRKALISRRCLVPTDGFFEWVKTPDGKQPYHIRFIDRRPFAFAGLWERWSQPGQEILDSFTILTTGPNELTKPIHNRMPVILAPEVWDDWLRDKPLHREQREALLVSYPADEMEAVQVCKRVNSPANDDPDCLNAPA